VDDKFDWTPRETDPGHGWPAQPGYGWNPPAPDPGLRPPNRNRRNALLIGGVLVLVLVLVVAVVNGLRTSGSRPSTGIAPPTTEPSIVPSPAPSGGSGGSGGVDPNLPVVACPRVVDQQSHLSYSCIVNDLTQGRSDPLLGLRISLNRQVEPGWILSEGSGNPQSFASPGSPSVIGYRQATPTLAAVTAEVHRRTAVAVSNAYGDGPTSRVLNEHSLTVSGVTGYELVTEITINPAFRAINKLATKAERLWVVGVPTKAGISIFMLSIPDLRKDLWPRAEATVGTIRIS
jgi:hypothetical protein